MKRWTLPLLALAAFSIPASAEDAMTIIKKHEAAKIAELETYLEATPDAADKDEVQAALLAGYDLTDQTKKGFEMCKQRYASLDKGKDANPNEVALGYVQPYFDFMLKGKYKDEAKAFAKTFAKDFAEHPQGEALIGYVNDSLGEFDKPMIGDVMEIAAVDTQGNKFDLADMKGKVVLVDFWATWCGPCIRELPHVKEAYAEYHAKGFEVLGISLDTDLKKLEAFTKENEMTWAQICDGKKWDSALAAKFGITGIPATFLIGKDGKIVATNLRGDNLSKQIEKNL